ncbi:AbiV family abortive infection protein [Klebsiella michiganensis]|uniref:AbiV family abortive infection protein n=1 Tax=Klebsiella michiganensis TaxID=1134687 RepID=UPI000AE328D9|nr:AbiV family abortive infection protein [Klebsiella michiganensis]
MSKDRINNVKVDVLIDGALKIVRNAQCLCDEADLLHQNKMYARSYALSHLAREEFAKSLMLYKVCIQVLCKAKVDWKKLDRRFRDHKEKVINDRAFTMMVFNNIFSQNMAAISPEILLNRRTVDFTNNRKNQSLYVDWERGKFVSPEENFTERQSVRNLEIAKFRIGLVSNTIAYLVKLKDLPIEEIKKIFPLDKIEQEAKAFDEKLDD